MKIGWQYTKLLPKLSGLLFWPTLYIVFFELNAMKQLK